jgi:uncharacterized membrane protein
MKTRTLRSALYLSAGLGLVVSLFAAAEFFDASLRGICSVNSFFSCALVDESGKTTTLGIQDYLWGVGGFIVMFVVAALAESRPRDLPRAYALVGLTTAAVVFSLYFLYVELAEIHALCIVCATAYGFGVLGWGFSLALLARTRRRRDAEADDAPPAGEPKAA